MDTSSKDDADQSDSSGAEQASDGKEGLKKEILDVIFEADKITLNPEQRAQKVWISLRQSPSFDSLSNWDLVCFGLNCVTMFHTLHPWLEDIAKRLSSVLHMIHYANYTSIVSQEKGNRTFTEPPVA